MKNKIYIGVLVAVILMVGIFFYIKNVNLNNTEISKIPDISTWKTYKNEELGFEFKYPEIFFNKLRIETFENTESFHILLDYKDNLTNETFFNINEQIKLGGLRIDINKENKENFEKNIAFGVQNFSTTSLAGNPGFLSNWGDLYYFRLKNDWSIGYITMNIYVDNSINCPKGYVDCSDSRKIENQKNDELFKAILSTLKFY